MQPPPSDILDIQYGLLNTLVLPTPVVLPAAAFTVSMWVKPDIALLDSSGKGLGSSLAYQAVLFAANDVYLSWAPPVGLTLNLGYGCSLSSSVDLFSESSPVWLHIVVMYDDSNGATQIYVNGSAVMVNVDGALLQACATPQGGLLLLGNLDASGQVPLAFAGEHG